VGEKRRKEVDRDILKFQLFTSAPSNATVFKRKLNVYPALLNLWAEAQYPG